MKHTTAIHTRTYPFTLWRGKKTWKKKQLFNWTRFGCLLFMLKLSEASFNKTFRPHLALPPPGGLDRGSVCDCTSSTIVQTERRCIWSMKGLQTWGSRSRLQNSKESIGEGCIIANQCCLSNHLIYLLHLLLLHNGILYDFIYLKCQ